MSSIYDYIKGQASTLVGDNVRTFSSAKPAEDDPFKKMDDLLEKAKKYAEKKAPMVAEQSAGQALKAGRSSGLSPAQAGTLGAQASSQSYVDAYNLGSQDYQKAYATQSGIDLEKDRNRIMQAQHDLAVQQANDPFNKLMTLFGGLGQAAMGGAALGMAFSDEGKKENIKDGKGVLEFVLSRMPSKIFNYKPGDAGLAKNPNEARLGVMAQDLEKTPLKAVVTDTPDGKMVDTPQLTLANTALISDMGKKMLLIDNFLKKIYPADYKKVFAESGV
jgi:hypothetical protein